MFDLAEFLQAVESGQTVPVSFRVGGRPAELALHSCRSEGNGLALNYRVENAPVQMRLHVERNAGHNLLSFGATLNATGTVPGRISEMRLLDLVIDHEDTELSTTLRTITGGTVKHYSHNSFPPVTFQATDRLMRGHDLVRFSEETGRCSNDILPLWLYYTPEGGIWFGPEWQGSWAMELHRLPEYTFAAVKLQFLDFAMQQGEEVRLPDMAIGTFQGDVQDGQNALRRAIRDVYMPDAPADMETPPAAYQILGNIPEGAIENEAAEAARLGAESFTFASVWLYPRTPTGEARVWWEKMGPYEPCEDLFKGGVRQFSDFCRNHGLRMGLWIDPRISEDVKEADRADDVLLRFDPAFEAQARRRYNKLSHEINKQPLIDLSRETGRAYLLEALEGMVDRYGADWIWYDFNCDPRPYMWDCHEEPDRRGLLELRYYQGLDDVMAEFMRRHPDVWVEMCASGGRMISLATMRQAHSLWITDYTGSDPDHAAGIRSGANMVLPAQTVHQSFYYPDEYLPDGEKAGQPLPQHYALAHFAGMFGLSQDLQTWPEQDREMLAEMTELYKDVRDLIDAGDFYRLTEPPHDRDAWDACQFHCPDTGEGLVLVLRLARSTRAEAPVALHGLDAGAELDLQVRSGDAEVTTRDGVLRIAFAEERGLLLTYRTR